MITADELQALIGLLGRTPMSPAETLFARGLLERLARSTTPEESTKTLPTMEQTEAAPVEATQTPEKAPPLRPDPLVGY